MFAIDIGAHSIKVAKLHKIKSGYQLDNYGVTLTPRGSALNGEILKPSAIAETLVKVLRESGIKDRRVIVAVTGQKVIIREITLPLMDEKELMTGILWEAPKYIPYNIDESIVDAEKVEEFEEKGGNKMMRVLLVATPKNIIYPYMEILKQIRIVPKIVDVISCANIRAFEDYFSTKKEEGKEGATVDIILSIGASSAILTLVEKNNLKFARNIAIGGNDITNAISKSLNIPFEEAEKLKRETGIILTPENEEEKKSEIDENTLKTDNIIRKIFNEIFKEVRKSLSYYKTQSQKVKYNKIILSGGSANIRNIDQFLSEKFEMPIIIGDPLQGIKIDERAFDVKRIKKLKESLATVIGLAKRER